MTAVLNRRMALQEWHNSLCVADAIFRRQQLEEQARATKGGEEDTSEDMSEKKVAQSGYAAASRESRQSSVCNSGRFKIFRLWR